MDNCNVNRRVSEVVSVAILHDKLFYICGLCDYQSPRGDNTKRHFNLVHGLQVPGVTKNPNDARTALQEHFTEKVIMQDDSSAKVKKQKICTRDNERQVLPPKLKPLVSSAVRTVASEVRVAAASCSSERIANDPLIGGGPMWEDPPNISLDFGDFELRGLRPIGEGVDELRPDQAAGVRGSSKVTGGYSVGDLFENVSTYILSTPPPWTTDVILPVMVEKFGRYPANVVADTVKAAVRVIKATAVEVQIKEGDENKDRKGYKFCQMIKESVV